MLCFLLPVLMWHWVINKNLSPVEPLKTTGSIFEEKNCWVSDTDVNLSSLFWRKAAGGTNRDQHQQLVTIRLEEASKKQTVHLYLLHTARVSQHLLTARTCQQLLRERPPTLEDSPGDASGCGSITRRSLWVWWFHHGGAGGWREWWMEVERRALPAPNISRPTFIMWRLTCFIN